MVGILRNHFLRGENPDRSLVQVRKIIHELIHVHAVHSIQPFQDLESKQMLHDMLKSPNDFLGHIRRYNNSVITSMTFG